MPSPALILEAVHELVLHGSANLGLARIWCGDFDGNIGSKRVQEKCGFRYRHTAKDVPCAIEGLLRDEHVSCLGREEWEGWRWANPAFPVGSAASHGCRSTPVPQSPALDLS